MIKWAVEMKGVRKTYRKGPIEVPALRSIDLRIAPGEFLAIAGASGCGKTTLLNIIGGLERADEGEVRVEGRDLQLLSSGELAPRSAAAHRIHLPGLQPAAGPNRTAKCRIYSAAAACACGTTKREGPEVVFGNRACRPRASSPRRVIRRATTTGGGGASHGHQPGADSGGRAHGTSRLGDGNLTSRSDGATHRAHGTTFAYATHDPQVMERARRLIRLHDGQIESDVGQPGHAL